MKKLFYGAALLAVAAGSFAFLPKEGEPTGYMMVSSGPYPTNNTITVTSADGQQTIEVDTKGNWEKGLRAMQRAEVAKLVQLRATGWVVTQMNTSSGPSGVITNYLLDKH